MGKSKQSQRTKNNARPSNSSRSAELLGTATPNFVGFSAVKDGGYIPILPGLSLFGVNEVEMNNVDTSFQILLKKMNKKDATTKFKALQEFAVMCKDFELSAIEGMLPFWPRAYCVLAIDAEHRVREAAQLAHTAVVKRVGKSIAIYLKQLAGVWFTSQYDTYPPAASAAANSFNETFPQKKVIDAIVHCQHEILTYISDNITVHTAESLSLQKSLTAEEMEAKYQKVLIASLQGYSYYLKKVPSQEIEKMIGIHRKIISSARFWKLVKHDAFPIKTAFFNVLTSMIENAEILVQDEKKRIVTAIMNSLDETEPGLLCAVWESMLIAINKIEDWYNVVNIEKLVLPKLWRVLRSGGQCSASIVYPNLLPFISQFPKLKADSYHLYVNFFNNMRQGFLVKSVQMSRSEMFAVTTSFVECLRYSILLNVENQNLCNTLLKEQLMPLLEVCLKENTPMKHIFFCEVTHLLRYWSRYRNNEEYKSYARLIQEFWNELNILFKSHIDVSQDSLTCDISYTNSAQIELLRTLKNAPGHSRKNLKVKFSNPDDDTGIQTQTKTIEIDTDTVFLAELNNFVNSLCIIYFKKINEQRTKRYITHLNKLITSFEDAEFSKVFSNSLSTEINLFNSYNEILKNWLIEKSNDTEQIVQLIFNLLKYVNGTEKEDILKSLTELDDIDITRSVVHCALSNENRKDVVIKKWCSQCNLTNLLIDVAKEIASGNYNDLEKNQNLILLAFETSGDGDLSINEESINEIVSILCNSFHRVDESCLLHFAKLIACIVPLTWSPKRSICGAMQVLETLFELCSQEYFNNDAIFTDTMRDVWKKGILVAVQKLSRKEFIYLTKRFATIMWNKIYNSYDENGKSVLVDLGADFLEVIINNNDNVETDYAREIVLTFLTQPDIRTWMAEVTGLVLYGEAITGKLYISTFDQKIQIYEDSLSIDLTSNPVVDNTVNCMKWALFNTKLVHNLYLRSSNEGESHEEELNSENPHGLVDILTNIGYSIILGRLYDTYYRSTRCYYSVHKFLTAVHSSFDQIKPYISKDVYNEMLENIKANYFKYGSMLPYIIDFYETDLSVTERPEQIFEHCCNNEIHIMNIERRLQGLQVLSQYLTLESSSVSMDDDISATILARSMVAKGIENSTYYNVLEKIMSYEKENPALLLLDCEVADITWEKLTFPLEAIRLLTEVITKIPTKLTYEHWNFALISLVLWQLSVTKSKRDPDDFKVMTMAIAVCHLYRAIQDVINKHEKEQITELPPTLLDEWKNVFAVDVQSGIFLTWMSYADSYNDKTSVLKPVIMLDCFGKAVMLLDGNMLFKEQPNVLSAVSTNFDHTIQLLLKLLQSPISSVQLGAYHVLNHMVSELVQRDKILVESENFDSNMLNIKRMEEVLECTQQIVNTILMDFKLCDVVSCTIQPYTDSYTYTMGYLWIWAIILDMCAKAQGDLRSQYAEILKDKFFPCLLNNIFRLMPVEAFIHENKNKVVMLDEMFTVAPYCGFGEDWNERRLDHIVCWLYTNSLRHLPVLVRQWWSTADSRVSAAVDKITMQYVSPMLCQEEMINKKLVNIENMVIKVHPSLREVVALYQMDDTKLELSMVLPPNHPLGPVTVEPGQHAGGTANWRNCHMQLSIFLTHQNGSIWDGLAMWKRNLDKKFAGIEECYICFSIFHLTTYQIPKLSCHTCRKKFHTHCLYKWFNTSQKSTCPICRNVF